MKKSALFLFSICTILLASAQQKQDDLAYIQRYKDVALEEMVRCGIPASITLAQGMHESNCGRSPLSREANNHFGIKCKEEWVGKKYYMDDDKPQECFRVYQHSEASYEDHSDFLVTRPRYAGLFKLPITDYKGWAKGLKECGYATNPKYAQILIGKIEEFNLQDLDQQGLAMIADKHRLMAYRGIQDGAPIAKASAPVAASTRSNNTQPVTATASASYKETKVKEADQKHTFFEPTNREPDRKKYTVNGSLALIAQDNEDALKVAFDYNIDYSMLLQYNDLEQGEHFKTGEYIFLQQKKNRGSGDMYVVQYGQSMRDISQMTGVKLKELYVKNQMKMNEQVCAGETINLQDRRSAAPCIITYTEYLKTQSTARTTSSVNNSQTNAPSTASKINYKSEYQVQPSDTLYSIARKFNISVEDLKAMNNLQDPHVKAGQTLVVPQ